MKWLLTLLLVSSLYGQGFGYNYIDPCNQQAVNLNYTTEMEANGFWVTYYNKRAFFTWIQVADGTLQNWTQQVYSDFEKLFPCAVNIAEEALASASTINLTDELEREDEEDIGASEPSFIGGDIVNTFYDYGSVATFNSVYTSENFDLTKEFNYTLNITLDLKKVLGLYGNTKKNKDKKQNEFWNAGALYYKTFEGSDWLITGNYGKILRNDIRQVGLLSSSLGQISNENFLNLNMMYGYRFPIKLRNGNQINLQTFVSYTLFRYFEGLKTENKYLLLESPILIYPGFNIDINFTETFKMNFGFNVGYNTLVNDLGERNINYSIVFGTNF